MPPSGAKEPAFAAQAQYNMGNCAFRQAQRQKDSDLKKAIEECQTSVGHFQEAVRLDPNQKKASENIEIVRLYLKNLLDEQQRRQEEKQEEDEIGKALKELIERQQTAVNDNGKLESARGDAANPPPADWDGGVAKLATDQEKLQADTAGLLTKMEERQQQLAQAKNQPAPAQPVPGQGAAPDPAALDKAAENSPPPPGTSVPRSTNRAPPWSRSGTKILQEAQPHQTKALEELVLALQELSDPQQQQQQQGQDQKQDQQKGQENQDKKDQQEQKDGEPKQEPGQEEKKDGEEKPSEGQQEEKSGEEKEGEEGQQAQAGTR